MMVERLRRSTTIRSLPDNIARIYNTRTHVIPTHKTHTRVKIYTSKVRHPGKPPMARYDRSLRSILGLGIGIGSFPAAAAEINASLSVH